MVVVIQVGGVVRGVVILLPVFEEQGNFSLAASPPNGEPGVSCGKILGSLLKARTESESTLQLIAFHTAVSNLVGRVHMTLKQVTIVMLHLEYVIVEICTYSRTSQ